MTAGAGRVGVLTGVPRWVHLTHAALGFLALVLLARLVGLRLNLARAARAPSRRGRGGAGRGRPIGPGPADRPCRLTVGGLRHSPGGDGTDQQSVGANEIWTNKAWCARPGGRHVTAGWVWWRWPRWVG